MTAVEARPGRDFLRVLALLGAMTAGLVLVGYLPTRELGGEGAVTAMLAGCGVSLAGSIAGLVPVLRSSLEAGPASPATWLASMGIRFFVVVVGALLVSLSDRVETTPFLVWIGISYLAFLAPDARYAVKQQQSD